MIPAIAIPLDVFPSGWAGKALWSSLGIVLAGICLVFTAIRSWPVFVRLLVQGGLVGIGYCVIPFFMLLGLAALGPRINAAAWKEFTPLDEGFSVEMPGNPILKQEMIPEVNLLMSIYTVELTHIDVAFLAGVVQFPEPAEGQVAPDKVFDASCREFLKALPSARKISQESMTYQNHPGREIVLDMSGQGVIVYRMYLVDDRFFILGAGGSRMKRTSPDIQRYFDSFRLTTVSEKRSPVRMQADWPPQGPVWPPPQPPVIRPGQPPVIRPGQPPVVRPGQPPVIRPR